MGFVYAGIAIIPDYNEDIENKLHKWSNEKLKGCTIKVKLLIDYAIDNEYQSYIFDNHFQMQALFVNQALS